MSKDFCELIKNIYDETYIKILTSFGKCKEFPYTHGTKQGDPLSPLMWAIFMNPILCMLNEQKGVRIGEEMISNLAFVDDGVLMSDTYEDGTDLLSIFNDFCCSNTIAMNHTKTVYTNNCDDTVPPPSIINPLTGETTNINRIKKDESYRYLGAEIRADGSDQAELFHQEKKVVKIIKNLGKRRLTPQLLATTINTLCFTKIQYSMNCHLYESGAIRRINQEARKQIRKKLKTFSFPDVKIHDSIENGGMGLWDLHLVQQKAFLSTLMDQILNGPPTPAKLIIEALSNKNQFHPAYTDQTEMFPLTEAFEMLKDHQLKLVNCNQDLLHHNHFITKEVIAGLPPELIMQHSPKKGYIPYLTQKEEKLSTQTPINIFHKDTEGNILVWTDGAALRKPNKASAGIWFHADNNMNKSIRTKGSQTINNAELEAVEEVLKIILSPIHIFTDSQNTITTINKIKKRYKWPKDTPNLPTIRRIEKLIENNPQQKDMKLTHVYSHVEDKLKNKKLPLKEQRQLKRKIKEQQKRTLKIHPLAYKGNEEADKLAKKGLSVPTLITLPKGQKDYVLWKEPKEYGPIKSPWIETQMKNFLKHKHKKLRKTRVNRRDRQKLPNQWQQIHNTSNLVYKNPTIKPHIRTFIAKARAGALILNSHRHKGEGKFCPYGCKENETNRHYICECNKSKEQSEKTKEQITKILLENHISRPLANKWNDPSIRFDPGLWMMGMFPKIWIRRMKRKVKDKEKLQEILGKVQNIALTDLHTRYKTRLKEFPP